MSKFLTEAEMILLGGLGSLVCCTAAMVCQRGYRRGPVGIAVVCIMIAALLPAYGFLELNMNPPVLFLCLISGCMALGSAFIVPVLTIAGLCDRTIVLKTRLWHAVLVVAAWVLGVWLVFFTLIGAIH